MRKKPSVQSEYHPLSLWETPRGVDPRVDAGQVDSAARVVLYDAQDRPMVRRIGFSPIRETNHG